jgi:hypothetical protein
VGGAHNNLMKNTLFHAVAVHEVSLGENRTDTSRIIDRIMDAIESITPGFWMFYVYCHVLACLEKIVPVS